MKNKIVVIKIGTNVITKDFKLDFRVLEAISNELAEMHAQGVRPVIVSSGAVAAGKEAAEIKEKSSILKKQMLASIGQARLMHIYEKLFAKHGIVIGQALLERHDFADREKYLSLKATLFGLLSNRIIPIINENDVIATEELRFSDNDQLAALTACALKANALIIFTDTDGFYTADPRLDDSAELIKEIPSITPDILNMAGGSSTALGLGGMTSKISSAKMASEQGIDTYICNGKSPGNLISILKGKNPGTHILPNFLKMKNLKNWALTSAVASGAIIVDKGAVGAIRKRKSLLIVGIRNVSGTFSDNSAVMIRDECGKDVAIGISNFSSDEIKKFHFGQVIRPEKEIVHANKIFLYEESDTAIN